MIILWLFFVMYIGINFRLNIKLINKCYKGGGNMVQKDYKQKCVFCVYICFNLILNLILLYLKFFFLVLGLVKKFYLVGRNVV